MTMTHSPLRAILRQSAATLLLLVLILLAACQPQDSAPQVAVSQPASASTAIPPPYADVAPRKGPHVLDWPTQESDLKSDPAVRYGRLANGMRYAIMANHTPPGTVSFRMRFDVGSLMEQDDQRGLAHFIEHMAFNGSKNVPEGEMVKMLQRHGLAFGADTNAYTSFDETVYMLDAPNVQPDTVRTAFFLMRELAGNLTFDPAAVERERGVILSEARLRDTPQYRAEVAENAFEFPHARFSQREPIGVLDVVRHAPAQRLRDLYDAYYRPDRAFFVVVGDVDVDAMEAKIRKTFGDWHNTHPDPGDPDLGTVAPPEKRIGFFHDTGLPTSVTLSAIRPPMRAPSTLATVRMGLLRDIGNLIVNRRLKTLARMPNASFLRGGISEQEVYDSADVTQIHLMSRPQDWEAALGTAERELKRALRYGFTQDEINEQVAQVTAYWRSQAEQAATRSTPKLASEITHDFAEWDVFQRPADVLAMFKSMVPDLTPKAVNAAFRAQWQGIDPLVFVASDKDIPDVVQRAQAVIAASEKEKVTPLTTQATEKFAYTDFGTPGKVVEQHEIKDLGITTLVFANGVRLNIKPTKFADNNVAIIVRFGNGTLGLPKGEPGLGLLVSSLENAGLGKYSADDLQRILAGHNVGTSISAGDDAFGLYGSTTPDDLPLQLQLMAAYLTDPGWRPEGLAQFRKTVQAQLRSLDGTPAGVQQRELPRLLHSGDPRFGIPAENELMARNYDELRTAMQHARDKGPIEIGIVGDVDVARATDLVARTFGALPMRDEEPSVPNGARAVAFPPPTKSPLVLHHQGASDQALALVYWPGVDDSNGKRMHTLELLRRVLQLKLTDEVRERDSASYSPNAQSYFSDAFPGYGYLGVALNLVPKDVDKFFGVVDDITASMAHGEISQDELERARLPLLDNIRAFQKQNGYWLRPVSTAQSDPAELARLRSAISDYQSVTIADLKTAAARYLRPQTAYRVAILPAGSSSDRGGNKGTAAN